MEEYLKTLLEQIRCKKAHASIYHEIRGHIEEQVADNIAEDMSKDDALKAALNEDVYKRQGQYHENPL